MSVSGPSWSRFRHIMYLFSPCIIVLFHLCSMKEELTTEQLKDWAQHLYTHEGNNEKAIAHKTGVEEAQVRQWATNGTWAALRKTLPTTRDYQLEQLYKLMEKVTEKLGDTDDPNPKDVDLVVKYTAAIKNLDTETTLQQIVEVAKLFTNWLKPRDLDLTKTITTQFDKFIRERVKPC